MNFFFARVGTLAACFLLAIAAPGARAQPADYPRQPVTLVVPFPAGGPTDAMARVLAQKLAERSSGHQQGPVQSGRPLRWLQEVGAGTRERSLGNRGFLEPVSIQLPPSYFEAAQA